MITKEKGTLVCIIFIPAIFCMLVGFIIGWYCGEPAIQTTTEITLDCNDLTNLFNNNIIIGK